MSGQSMVHECIVLADSQPNIAPDVASVSRFDYNPYTEPECTTAILQNATSSTRGTTLLDHLTIAMQLHKPITKFSQNQDRRCAFPREPLS
jgi:hypothetical protein